MMKILKFIGRLLLDFMETLVMALSIFVVVYLFLFQPHQVKGKSMYDTFFDGDYLLTNKISYRFSEPQRGDVIIFKAPTNEDYDYIKRIIGLPEDKVMIKKGNVYINGKKLDESPYFEETTRAGAFLRENQILEVPEGNYFVMGDNRGHSSDSRDFGTIPYENIVGKAFFRYWPPQKFGTVGNADYEGNLNLDKSLYKSFARLLLSP